MTKTTFVIPVEKIERSIFLIRGQRVMLDRDLAYLYGVPTKVLNQAVKRNERRFPSDFMFRLTKEEKNELVTNCDRLARLKHSSALPSVFTEQGVAMLSSVLNSERAIEVISQSCALLSACGKLWPVARNSHGGWRNWRDVLPVTIKTFERCSRRSAS